MSESPNYILKNPHFEANIFYLRPEEGGRSIAVSSGYRGQFYYNGKNWDAGQQFIDKVICQPGDSAVVLMQTASPTNHEGQLFVNKRFEIREGSKVVGTGKITKLLYKEFQKTAFNIYEEKIINLILEQNKLGITLINDLDGVKSLLFRKEKYVSIQKLIRERKWYLIDDGEIKDKSQDFYEYLYIETFSDQHGKEYAAILYDNDELWQDPEIIEIVPLP